MIQWPDYFALFGMNLALIVLTIVLRILQAKIIRTLKQYRGSYQTITYPNSDRYFMLVLAQIVAFLSALFLPVRSPWIGAIPVLISILITMCVVAYWAVQPMKIDRPRLL